MKHAFRFLGVQRRTRTIDDDDGFERTVDCARTLRHCVARARALKYAFVVDRTERAGDDADDDDGRGDERALSVARVGARDEETARDRRARGGDVARSRATNRGARVRGLGASREVCEEAAGVDAGSGERADGDDAVETRDAGVEGARESAAHAEAGCDQGVFDHAREEVFTRVVAGGDGWARGATGEGGEGDGGRRRRRRRFASGVRVWVFGATVQENAARDDVGG